MKKMIPTLIAALFATSFGVAHAQEVSTDPARAEAVEKKAEDIRTKSEMRREARQQQREEKLERKSHVAKAHKKADKEKLQQQQEKRLERKAHVAKAHKKARGDAVEVVPNTENRQ